MNAQAIVLVSIIALVGTTFGNQTPAATVASANGPTHATGALVLNCLDDNGKNAICNQAKPATLCATAGPSDAACTQISSAVHGTNPCCVASNVCKFTVKAIASAANGTTTAGPTAPIIQEPNAVYVSFGTNCPGYTSVKSCSSNGLNIVHPAAHGPSESSKSPNSASSSSSAPILY